jgi:hypothetical protein
MAGIEQFGRRDRVIGSSGHRIIEGRKSKLENRKAARKLFFRIAIFACHHPIARSLANVPQTFAIE